MCWLPVIGSRDSEPSSRGGRVTGTGQRGAPGPERMQAPRQTTRAAWVRQPQQPQRTARYDNSNDTTSIGDNTKHREARKADIKDERRAAYNRRIGALQLNAELLHALREAEASGAAHSGG